jgi:membrane protease YdiL (CAAX protease family)
MDDGEVTEGTEVAPSPGPDDSYESYLTDETKGKLADLGIAVGLAVGGMAAGLVATVIVLSAVTLADLGLSETARNILLMLPLQIGGLAGTAVAFLWMTDRGFGYVRLRKPSLKQLGIAFGSIFAMIAAVIAVTVVIESLGQQAADHATTQQIESDPRLALYMIPLALFVIGPCEELLFRGVIQTKLTESFGARGGVVVASVVFSLVHVPSYGGLSAGLSQLGITLGVLFSLAIILGTVYEKTDNLAVPIVAHGFYNAVLFGITYIGTQYADELEQAAAVL